MNCVHHNRYHNDLTFIVLTALVYKCRLVFFKTYSYYRSKNVIIYSNYLSKNLTCYFDGRLFRGHAKASLRNNLLEFFEHPFIGDLLCCIYALAYTIDSLFDATLKSHYMITCVSIFAMINVRFFRLGRFERWKNQ